MGLLADADVGEEPEEGAAPVGAAPGVGVVEAAVAGFGEAVGHAFDEVAPEALFGDLADADAGDGFEVVGHSFAHPGIAAGELRLGEVEHFVGEHPVGDEFVVVGAGAEANVDAVAVVFDTSPDGGGAGGEEMDGDGFYGVAAVEMGECGGGALDPGGEFIGRDGERVRGDDIDDAAGLGEGGFKGPVGGGGVRGRGEGGQGGEGDGGEGGGGMRSGAMRLGGALGHVGSPGNDRQWYVPMGGGDVNGGGRVSMDGSRQ